MRDCHWLSYYTRSFVLDEVLVSIIKALFLKGFDTGAS